MPKREWETERNLQSTDSYYIIIEWICDAYVCVCVCACYVCARMNEWDSKCAFHVKKNLHHQTFNYLYKCEKQKAEQDEKRNHQDIFGVCRFETKNFAHRRPTPPMPCRSLRETHIFSKTPNQTIAFIAEPPWRRINFVYGWKSNYFWRMNNTICEVWLWKKKNMSELLQTHRNIYGGKNVLFHHKWFLWNLFHLSNGNRISMFSIYW